MKTQRGFVSAAVLIAIVLGLIVVGGGAYYVMQPQSPSSTLSENNLDSLGTLPTTNNQAQQTQTTTNTPIQTTQSTSQPTANRTYAGTEFEATIPSSWKAVTGAAGEEGHVSLRSADYNLKSSAEVNERMGESKNWLKTGMEIEVFPQGNEVTGSWKDPAAYVQYFSSMPVSNLVTQKEISLDGQPALLSRVRGDDGSISEGVRTVRNGREFQMTFRFANETSVDWAVWNRFLSSFKFRQSSASTIPTVIGTKDYKGAWFKITYPASFVSKAEGADEASFTSPDGSVQFYVYSPQWSGNPVSYLQALPTETVESDTSTPDITSSTNSYGTTYNKKVIRYVTLAAKDGSYRRSFVSTTAGYVITPDSNDYSSKTHTVFGIKYQNQAVYDKYLNDYLAFKKSLVQYAD